MVKCWYGIYGGHYDVIVFFKNPPTHFEDDKIAGNCVDMLAESENKNILGSMGLEDFLEMSGLDRKDFIPPECEIVEVYEIEITAPFDNYGQMVTYSFDVDGWQ